MLRRLRAPRRRTWTSAAVTPRIGLPRQRGGGDRRRLGGGRRAGTRACTTPRRSCAADPGGFLGAFVGGELAGAVSAVRYGGGFGFIGLFIVRPEYRKYLLGVRLGRAALELLDGRCIGTDGVPGTAAPVRAARRIRDRVAQRAVPRQAGRADCGGGAARPGRPRVGGTARGPGRLRCGPLRRPPRRLPAAVDQPPGPRGAGVGGAGPRGLTHDVRGFGVIRALPRGAQDRAALRRRRRRSRRRSSCGSRPAAAT